MGTPPCSRAAVFDLDDTLYPERDYVRGGYRAAARRLIDVLGFARPTAPTEDAAASWLWNRFLSGQAAGAFDAMGEHFGLRLNEEAISALVAAYREHKPDIRAYDGAAEMLSTLRPDYRLGLLSDGFLPAQRLKLEALGLGRFFDAVVFTEQLGRDAWKPSPRGFDRVAELLDLPFSACAYVADNPAKDFVAPNALGWRTIQYVRPGQIHADNPAPGGEPRFVVRGPGELLAALRA